jgi:hypothetical protein
MSIPQDRQVWDLAAAVMAKHGDDALDEAERRAKQALDQDDVMGHGIWLQVASAIRELARSAGGRDPVN